jgi:single-strand DNA-binding protein
MNNWNFTGNLGKSAEVKATQSGKTVCTFSVAVTSGYGDNKKTTWANCVLFGKRAEGQLPQYLVQGQKVAISGEAVLETWDKQDGSKGTSLKVMVNSLDLIGEKKASTAEFMDTTPQQAQQQAPPQQQGDDFSDDIPFANPYKNIEHLV